MSQLWCLDCQKPFDALQGHNCVQSCVIHSWIQERVNGNNSNFQTIVDRQYGTRPLTFPVTEQETNPSASVSTKLGNANPDFSMHTSLNDLATNSRDQLNYSSQECASEIMNRQFKIATSEANLTSNMENKHHDFAMALGSADHLIPNKVGTNTPGNEHPSVSHDQMALKDDPIAEINRQFLKYGQTAQGMIRGENLGNTTHDLAFKETEPNQRLMATNIHAVNITNDTDTYTGSLNTRVSISRRGNEVEKRPFGCPSATSENKLTFNDKTYNSSQNKTAEKDIYKKRTSETAHSCFIEDASAVVGPSCSQNIENTCPVCHKEFSNKQNMNRHYPLHFGEKPFTCEICEIGFTRKEHLKTHMVVHTGEKAHKCDVCGKSFARKGYLQKHSRIHTGDKQYKCDI